MIAQTTTASADGVQRKRAKLVGEIVDGWQYADSICSGLEAYGWEVHRSEQPGSSQRYLAAVKDLVDPRYRSDGHKISLNLLRSGVPVTVIDKNGSDVTDSMPEHLARSAMDCLGEIEMSMAEFRESVKQNLAEQRHFRSRGI